MFEGMRNELNVNMSTADLCAVNVVGWVGRRARALIAVVIVVAATATSSCRTVCVSVEKCVEFVVFV